MPGRGAGSFPVVETVNDKLDCRCDRELTRLAGPVVSISSSPAVPSIPALSAASVPVTSTSYSPSARPGKTLPCGTVHVPSPWFIAARDLAGHRYLHRGRRIVHGAAQRGR